MRALVVGLLVVLAVGAFSPSDAVGSCPVGEPTISVRVHGAGGGIDRTEQVCRDDLDPPDVTNRQYYTSNGSSAPSNEPYVGAGASVSAVLSRAGVSGVTRVSAQSGPGAHQTLLDEADLGTDYPGGLTPVFFSESSQFIRFARPMRDEADVNYQDVWSSDAGGTVILDAYTSGRVLHPIITASATSSQVGQPVAFTVSFRGAPPSQPTYAWDFGDGGSSTAAAPSHAWGRGGSSYSVNLTVRGGGDASGDAQAVMVRVGAAPQPSAAPTAPGTGAGGHHHPATGPSSGTGHAEGGTASNAPGTSSTGSTGPPATEPTGTGAQPSVPPSSKGPAPEASDVAGQQVSGVLLVNAAAPPQPPAQPTVRTAAAARAVPRLTWDRRLLWILLVPGLMSAGALTQTRWLARRLPVPGWRR